MFPATGPSVNSAVAAERATPAKRARKEGASLAPAPELAAASVNQEMERRVRRCVTNGIKMPDQGAASSAAAGSQVRLPGSKPFTRSAAASQRQAHAFSPVPERLRANGGCLSWRSEAVTAHAHIKPRTNHQVCHVYMWEVLQHRCVVSQGNHLWAVC